MTHKTQFRFYIQPYSVGETKYPRKDIETEYSCDYMRFSDFDIKGDVKNIYEEDFAEKSGKRVFIPPKPKITYSAYECKLKLFFKGTSAKANADRFEDDMLGTKIEWFDTFRGKYATLLMKKKKNIEIERLYGNQQYVVAEYTFENIEGQVFDTSQIPTK